MNKDELKDKKDNLKERVKEAFGEKKKQAEGFVDKMRETVREKIGKEKTDVSRDVSRAEDDE